MNVARKDAVDDEADGDGSWYAGFVAVLDCGSGCHNHRCCLHVVVAGILVPIAHVSYYAVDSMSSKCSVWYSLVCSSFCY